MAARMLAAGYPLAAWARRPEAIAPFAAQGATTAGGVALASSEVQLGGTFNHKLVQTLVGMSSAARSKSAQLRGTGEWQTTASLVHDVEDKVDPVESGSR